MIRPGSILGNRVLRSEDPGLLRGSRRYVADLDLPGELYAAFARSPVAHGRLVEVHVAQARQMPGVVAVWTASELDIAPHHGFMKVHDDFARPPLATDRVRFVGDSFAVVFAETAAQAEDAANAVWADIEPLPPVIDPEAALLDGAEVIFPVRGSNQAMMIPDASEIDLDAVSDVVVRGRYVNQRMAVAPIEVDCCAAAPSDDGRITIFPSTQMPHALRDQLAQALGWPPADVHVVTPQVGGGFGGKAGLHPEYGVVAKAARVLDRPVVWVPTRSEDLQALPHSRGQIQYVELGCKRDGTFTGLRVRLVGDAGAYPTVGAFLSGGTRRMSHGTYDFPAIKFDVAVAVTNTTPMGAYRGAGRPEATALLERVVDQAAIELGIDPIRQHLRLGSLHTPVAYGRGSRRLRRTTRRTSGASRARRPQPARHRGRGLRRDHRGRNSPRVRCGRSACRRFGDCVRGYLGPRTGPSDRLRHARVGANRYPCRTHHARRRRHRPSAPRWWHGRVALIANRRVGRAQSDRGARRESQATGGRSVGSVDRRCGRRCGRGHRRCRRCAGHGPHMGPARGAVT
ncbi:MAG: xanthine dehydrogenase family protein molybdopterin-binding subunit [Actinobacteria bacterium]|nr:MAG: xanthine dehydrogenase family protein molybdopterin-binding subunit [Actinomycetota bacterium]